MGGRWRGLARWWCRERERRAAEHALGPGSRGDGVEGAAGRAHASDRPPPPGRPGRGRSYPSALPPAEVTEPTNQGHLPLRAPDFGLIEVCPWALLHQYCQIKKFFSPVCILLLPLALLTSIFKPKGYFLGVLLFSFLTVCFVFASVTLISLETATDGLTNTITSLFPFLPCGTVA